MQLRERVLDKWFYDVQYFFDQYPESVALRIASCDIIDIDYSKTRPYFGNSNVESESEDTWYDKGGKVHFDRISTSLEILLSTRDARQWQDARGSLETFSWIQK